MNDHSKDSQTRYFREAAIVLAKEGFQLDEVHTDRLCTVIGETTDSISDKAMWREYERRYPQRKSNRQKQKHNHDFDMSR